MRLVTRADFDGLVCGALITKFETVNAYLFVEPKFMQDGQVDIRRGDIIANLPYHRQLHPVVRSSHHQHDAGLRSTDRPWPRRFSLSAERGAGGLRVLHRSGQQFRGERSTTAESSPALSPPNEILPFLNPRSHCPLAARSRQNRRRPIDAAKMCSILKVTCCCR